MKRGYFGGMKTVREVAIWLFLALFVYFAIASLIYRNKHPHLNGWQRLSRPLDVLLLR